MVDDMTSGRSPGIGGWIVDVIAGIAGLVVGAIVAVNIVIFGGITDGYEASPVEVFDESAIVGVLAAGALVAGPIVGVWTVRRLRRDVG